jgi:hypothetical protein
MSEPVHPVEYLGMKGWESLRKQGRQFVGSRRDSMFYFHVSPLALRANIVERACTRTVHLAVSRAALSKSSG